MKRKPHPCPANNNPEQPSTNWLYWLPEGTGGSHTHNVRIITNPEGLMQLMQELVERLLPTASRADQPLLVSIQKAAEWLSVSTRTILRRIEAGELEAVRDGDLVRVTSASIEQYIRRHSTQQGANNGSE